MSQFSVTAAGRVGWGEESARVLLRTKGEDLSFGSRVETHLRSAQVRSFDVSATLSRAMRAQTEFRQCPKSASTSV